MKLADFLEPEEIRYFTERSDHKAYWIIAANWLMIAGIFAMVYIWPNVLTIFAGLFLMGGRQLGLGVLMHEAGHRSLFKTQDLNYRIGQWLCAYPVFGEIQSYADSHRVHHKLAGSEQDPDLPNYQTYPVTKASFRRKMWRDLSGQSGFKLLVSIFANKGDMVLRDGKNNQSRKHLIGALICNAVLLILLTIFASPWLYLLWLGAFVTTYTWCARIRQIAEHGAVTGLFDPDPRAHTRTTLPNLLERAIVCPNYVNYHCEHHFAAAVPCYRLKELHECLQQKGFYKDYPQAIARGYREVINTAVPA